MRWPRLMIMLIILSACQEELVETQERELQTIIASVPAAWPQNAFPLKLSFSNDFLSELSELQELNSIAKLWDKEVQAHQLFTDSPLEVTNYEPAELNDFAYGLPDGPEFGIYKSYRWYDELEDNVIALTQWWAHRVNPGTPYETYEIIHADIILNYRDNLFSDQLAEAHSYDLKTTVLHELGHLLGLGHDQDFKSVMYSSINKRTLKRSLFRSDILNIRAKYPNRSFSALRSSAQVKGPLVRGRFELKKGGECLSKTYLTSPPFFSKR